MQLQCSVSAVELVNTSISCGKNCIHDFIHTKDKLTFTEFIGHLLPPALPVQGSPPEISCDLVEMPVKNLNSGKASGPSDITAETIKAAGAVRKNQLHSLTNKIVTEGAVPPDWLKSYILCLFKGKGSPTERGNYRGLKLI